ncbi:MAG: SGNH/GDSL hydrolase family protein [Clostridiales bacterium]|nr:SGNH/GDSL hydrolase family protein [Clostridiales bacterium]
MDSVYFLGDSTTAHLSVRGGIPRERIFTGVGSTLLYTSVLDKCIKIGDNVYSVFEAVRIYSPEILVITVGASGGAGFLSKDKFKYIYKSLIENIKQASPKTRIIVQSIYPLSDKSKNHYKKLTKGAVYQANIWINEVCAECGVPYIDAHSLLVDKNGYLKSEYQNDEYLHLTRAAYKVILDNLYHYLEQNISLYN